MTAVLGGGEWSAARHGRTLPPGKTRYPFYRRLGGPQGCPGRAENLVSTGIQSPNVQPIVSRYTDWATRPTVPISYVNLLGITVILLYVKWSRPMQYTIKYNGYSLCLFLWHHHAELVGSRIQNFRLLFLGCLFRITSLAQPVMRDNIYDFPHPLKEIFDCVNWPSVPTLVHCSDL